MIDPSFIAWRKGKAFPLYAGLLDAATKSGLRGLTTRVIQIPSPDNGMMAVVMARASFEDGREFEDVGDADPSNTKGGVSDALLRIASTRAKGRCLRDSINVGQTMLEELSGKNGADDDEEEGEIGEPDLNVARPLRVTHESAGHTNGNGRKQECCAPDCGRPLTKGQYDVSIRAYGQPLCPGCQKHHTRVG